MRAVVTDSSSTFGVVVVDLTITATALGAKGALLPALELLFLQYSVTPYNSFTKFLIRKQCAYPGCLFLSS